MKDEGKKKEEMFIISTEIKCDGGNIIRDRKEEKEVGKPDAELPKTKTTGRKTAMILGTFIVAFAAAFYVDLKMKAKKEAKGEIKEVKFTLHSSDKEKPIKEVIKSGEEMEELSKTTLAKK